MENKRFKEKDDFLFQRDLGKRRLRRKRKKKKKRQKEEIGKKNSEFFQGRAISSFLKNWAQFWP